MSIAPLKPVSLAGPSGETHEYVQQLFAIESGQEPENFSAWPSEATNPEMRPLAIVQQVGAILGAGRHYTADPLLSCDQVTWAAQHVTPSWNLNPLYLKALERGAEVAGRHTGKIPWATKNQPLKLVGAGSYGITPLSGYYGTGHGTLK